MGSSRSAGIGLGAALRAPLPRPAQPGLLVILVRCRVDLLRLVPRG